ncbi:MAG: hypothetical protein LC720_00395 [Actinobacteria bacterium]|nr:hypothetical protein [Actinomycetota bacterium]
MSQAGPSWSWLALVAAAPDDAEVFAPAFEPDGELAGYLAAWGGAGRAAPRAGALRVCRRLVDPAGAPALVSLVLAPPGRRLAFDDTAIAQARRAVLAGRPARAVSTLLSDDSRFEGAITAWSLEPAGAPRDDPFARIFPARLLRVGPGLIGCPPPPCGPTIERYGSAAPWPWDRFGI